MLDLKIFVDTDADIRLLRRITRDIVDRGREIEGVLKSYNRFVRHSYVDFIKPTMRYSDLIVPHGA
jgi:uridine kinase